VGPAELAHRAKAGLDISVRLLKPIKEQSPILSYANVYQVNFLPEIAFQSHISPPPFFQIE